MSPVATVRSCFGEKFAIPRQPGLCPSAWGRLVFHPEYRSPEAVRGIEGFSHLWLIFGFHETAGQGWKPTVRPPRLGGNQRVGVFASRSTFRPNGLGLSLVKFEGVDLTDSEGPVLLLGGLDLVDGTPVYDVKPYLPYAEALPEAAGGYAEETLLRMPVEISPDAGADFLKLPPRARAVLMEALSLDPRPATRSEDSDREFGALLCGCNVRFVIRSGICRITGIEKTARGSGLNA
ncbi:tRNA (N6-threonylcarbamoyladenosine(37)-N6)-methyltransferase TrmO [Luteolibacter yonseiensis]|uniref:tRNA (N6-threonylcarbamoyladenosine(37)-N6)-methyltransferase TrmO n=1 Tax=Luteolibacter yonseiensis TaxID=1144680 RepID=A0A934R7J2_9BACT|nr:tRNA (N6-threonylcarbamoyladenosine(37)-N6)-methyltransferase TrmO [Luteolibacter yonseiensis]